MHTLNIDFATSQAEIVVQPQNLADIACKLIDPTLMRYLIEDAMDIFWAKQKRTEP